MDIGQALALDWQAVGLKPKLLEIDFPRVRELYRTKTIHGALVPSRHAARALDRTAPSIKPKIRRGIPMSIRSLKSAWKP